jgi:hypothetical protein
MACIKTSQRDALRGLVLISGIGKGRWESGTSGARDVHGVDVIE